MQFPFLDIGKGYVYTRSKQKSAATSENRYVFVRGKRKKKNRNSMWENMDRDLLKCKNITVT